LAGGRLFALADSPDKGKSRKGDELMRGKNIKYLLVVAVLLALGFGMGRLSAAAPRAAEGTLDAPGSPEETFSYTLADIYNRLNDGTQGARGAFTEPGAGPTVGTGHTLDEVMAIAPAVDDTNGATQADVLAGKTAWGLTSGEWGPITGTYGGLAYPAPVPKTGQTASYAFGDDGHLEKGVAWPSPRFITSTTGVVTDTLTGLVWLQDAGCLGLWAWADALTQIAYLRSGTDFSCDNYAAGTFGDWRLPNVRELQSLVDYSQYGRALLSGHPFTGVQSSSYWSGTTYAGDTSYAWNVWLGSGTVDTSSKTHARYVWPVRGGQ
jgi:hypothetical protein